MIEIQNINTLKYKYSHSSGFSEEVVTFVESKLDLKYSPKTASEVKYKMDVLYPLIFLWFVQILNSLTYYIIYYIILYRIICHIMAGSIVRNFYHYCTSIHSICMIRTPDSNKTNQISYDSTTDA